MDQLSSPQTTEKLNTENSPNGLFLCVWPITTFVNEVPDAIWFWWPESPDKNVRCKLCNTEFVCGVDGLYEHLRAFHRIEADRLQPAAEWIASNFTSRSKPSPSDSKICKGRCGDFFGTAANLGYCSSCFKTYQELNLDEYAIQYDSLHFLLLCSSIISAPVLFSSILLLLLLSVSVSFLSSRSSLLLSPVIMLYTTQTSEICTYKIACRQGGS